MVVSITDREGRSFAAGRARRKYDKLTGNTAQLRDSPSPTTAMQAETSARQVHSNQPDLHPRLREVVRRHLRSEYRRPIADHNQRAFDRIVARVQSHHGPLLLDSFCGVGASTSFLAARYPDALVIGIDKSSHRLGRHHHHRRQQETMRPAQTDVDNCLLVQAEIEDFWRLALAAGWRPARHSLFYPNPWPKAEHLGRRVHGSPLLPVLLALGGELELRSNWRLYLAEFAAAVELTGWQTRLQPLTATLPLTPFERKYAAAAQPLWQLHCWAPTAL